MESIWQEIPLPTFPRVQGDMTCDVLVIGGGMAGLLCAHQLTQAGVHCILAEAATIASGITKNTTAKITSQHGLICRTLVPKFGLEATGLYLQANEQAVQTYKALCQDLDCDFSEQDNFIYSTQNREVLEEEMTMLEQLDFPAEFVETLPLPFPTAGAVKFSHQAQFHPLKFLKAIAPKLTIFERSPVRKIRKNTAVTDYGTITAGSILVATHFPFLNTHGSYFLKLYQQRSYAMALKNVPEISGMYLEATENGLSLRSHNGTLILGGGGHRTGKEGENWAKLEAIAASWFPEAAITHRWATQDCMSLDGLPYIGRYSAMTPNLYVAAGFNKWGMTTSMVAAQVLTDLVQGKENPYADLFSPSRSILHPQLGINAMESTKNLLTFSSKRCPHLGCALKWNPQERSWDCPCHGSRFTEDGSLIDNPATGDLKKRS